MPAALIHFSFFLYTFSNEKREYREEIEKGKKKGERERGKASRLAGIRAATMETGDIKTFSTSLTGRALAETIPSTQIVRIERLVSLQRKGIVDPHRTIALEKQKPYTFRPTESIYLKRIYGRRSKRTFNNRRKIKNLWPILFFLKWCIWGPFSISIYGNLILLLSLTVPYY